MSVVARRCARLLVVVAAEMFAMIVILASVLMAGAWVGCLTRMETAHVAYVCSSC